MQFNALVYTEDAGRYHVTVPDLPGLHAEGLSADDALQHAQSALTTHLQALINEGVELPHPTRMINIKKHIPEGAEYSAIVFDIDLDGIVNPVERINVAFRRLTLEMVDGKAESLGMNRSEFLAFAAANTDGYVAQHFGSAYFVKDGRGKNRTNEERKVSLGAVLNTFPHHRKTWFPNPPTFGGVKPTNQVSPYRHVVIEVSPGIEFRGFSKPGFWILEGVSPEEFERLMPRA